MGLWHNNPNSQPYFKRNFILSTGRYWNLQWLTNWFAKNKLIYNKRFPGMRREKKNGDHQKRLYSEMVAISKFFCMHLY